MSKSSLGAGHRQTLIGRLKKALVNSAIAASVAAASFTMLESPAVSGGETRTISLYHMHTGESLSVTYMQNGRYVPSAMKQINYLLRDWRKNAVVTIDPKTIDLVWELHEDLGSRGPIHIVCGYRSPKTNAFLRRIGRNVARKSAHMVGKAIDFYFPDVPTIKIRNSALVRRVGGVGYYRSAGGPTGFVHLDSGNIRHWGPLISNVQMAQIVREGARTVGRRMRLNGGNQNNDVMPETTGNGGGLLAALFGKKKPQVQPTQQVAVAAAPEPMPVESAYAGDENDMADLTADAAVAPVSAKAKPVLAEIVPPIAKPAMAAKIPTPSPTVPKDQIAALNAMAQDASQAPSPVEQVADNGAAEPLVKQGYPIPKPRLKPVEVMLMAAANMKADQKMIRISAASAPPPDQSGTNKLSPVADNLGTEMLAENPTAVPTKLTKAKSTFAAELRNGTTDDAPVIKPLLASAGGSDINWWPQLFLNGEAAIRRDGAPAIIGATQGSSLPMAASLTADGSDITTQTPADGKGDLLVVNREGKGALMDDEPVHTKSGKLQKLSSN
jgi:uncharacterized protein YcbK (DUF882 family)